MTRPQAFSKQQQQQQQQQQQNGVFSDNLWTFETHGKIGRFSQATSF